MTSTGKIPIDVFSFLVYMCFFFYLFSEQTNVLWSGTRCLFYEECRLDSIGPRRGPWSAIRPTDTLAIFSLGLYLVFFSSKETRSRSFRIGRRFLLGTTGGEKRNRPLSGRLKVFRCSSCDASRLWADTSAKRRIHLPRQSGATALSIYT